MAGGAPPSSSTSSSSGLPPPPPPPKILLAKPSPAGAGGHRLGREDDPSGVLVRPRNATQPGSLNLLSESWEIQSDRVLPFLTENSDFVVVGIIGPPGVGKSTIMNELYGFDGSSPGMLPPFATQSDETKAMAKHCTVGVELRVSSERLILLDAQPVFSPSVLIDMMRPDGSSTIPVLNGENLSADLAHELMGIQGIHDFTVWQLMLTVDLLKHNIPDPSLLTSHPQGSSTVSDKENRGSINACNEEYLADLVFIHTKLREQDLSPSNVALLRKDFLQFFKCSSFSVIKCEPISQVESSSSPNTQVQDSESIQPDLFFLPLRVQDNSMAFEVESYSSMLGKLRDQILSMNPRPFSRNISERDWLRSTAKIWESVKKSPVIADYCRTLKNSGLFRK